MIGSYRWQVCDTAAGEGFSELAWSPDGKYVAYVVPQPGGRQSHIALLNALSGEKREPRAVTEERAFLDWAPCFSRCGQYLH